MQPIIVERHAACGSRKERALAGLLERTLRDKPAFEVSFCSGYRFLVGQGIPGFRLAIHTERGLRAVQSLDELSVCEAYMDADLDIDGNLLEAVALRELLNDQSVWITLWRKLQPILTGRRKANETWVQNHYDLNNIQLQFIDTAYNTYTPGVFENESETLEVASERKHRLAYEGLGIGPGSRILDIGFGWGSFLRYAARKGVHVTGITLSRHQLAYVQRELVETESLPAKLVYSDFFNFEPEQSFDAIAMLGVIEELADYPRVLERIACWIKPGGRVYLDFMAATQDFVFPAFISKYIYQGRTSRVYLPKFIDAVTRSRFELLAAHNDRRNYYLTCKHWYENFERNQARIRGQFGERNYRLFQLYLAGCPIMLDHPTHLTTAYRVFLELPGDRT